MRTKEHTVTIFSLACITCKRRHTRDLFSAARPVEIESSQSHGQFPGQKAAGRDNGRAGLHQGRHQQQGQMTTLPSSSFPLAKLMFSLSSALYPARWSRPEDDPAGRRCRQVWYDPGSNSCYFAHSVSGAAEAATARVGAIGIVNAATDEFVVDIPIEARGVHSAAVNARNQHIFVPVAGKGILVLAPSR